MSVIEFSNGQKVEFNGTPTEADIQSVISQLGLDKPQSFGEKLQGTFGNSLRDRIASEQVAGGQHAVERIKKGTADVQAGMEKGGFAGVGQTLKGFAESGLGATAGALRSGFAPVTATVSPVLEKTLPASKKLIDVYLKANHPGLYAAYEKFAPQVKEMVAPKIEEVVTKYPDAMPIISDLIATVGGAAGGDINLTSLAKQGITGLAPKEIATGLGDVASSGYGAAKSAISAVTPESSAIMNRVARLTPTEAATFERMAGMSHGEYLTKTGNFANPENIIRNEAEKFVSSINEVDNALAQLPGTYKTGEISDVLDGIIARAEETSGANIKSPYLKRANELKLKHDTVGLTMDEINEAKRLYERNVKLGYNKFNNPVAVEKATNIDNALREWQVKKADELGFSNIADINKQTRLSKFIVDKLGKKLAGETGNNALSLTDWIMLSGGEPSSVAGLLTKKVFSNKSVQARIAKMLAGEPTIPFVKAKIGETKFPRLGPGLVEKPTVGTGSTIPVAPTGSNIEFTGQKGGITPAKPTTQLQQEKLLKNKSSSKVIQNTAKRSSNLSTLEQEAKKYKSAEEFVKAQPKLYHGGSADIKDIQLGKSNFQKTFYMSENPDYAKSYGGNKSSLNEIMVDSKAKLADLRKSSDDLVKQIEDIISSKPTGKTVRIQKPDGTFLEIPETKGGLSNPVHSSKDILNGIRQGKAYFAEMPEVKNALKKLGYDGMITQESSMGANFGVWNKDVLKTKSQLEEIWKKANQVTPESSLINEAKK